MSDKQLDSKPLEEYLDEHMKSDKNTFSDDMQGLIKALRDNRAAMAQEIGGINRKLDDLPTQLEALRREHRESSDQMRREFNTRLDDQRRELQTLFIPRAEYDPSYKGVMRKFDEYDKMIADSRQEMPKYYALTHDVEEIKADLKSVQDKGGIVFTRVVAAIAITVSVISTAITVFSHTSFHP